jgi:hypothetical protein
MLSPCLWRMFADSPEGFIARYQQSDASVAELQQMAQGGLHQITLPATIMLGQKLRHSNILAHEWTLGSDDKDVLLSIPHRNIFPYFWELGRRQRLNRVAAVMSRLAATHRFYSGLIAAPTGKVGIDDVKATARHLRIRLAQLQKSEVLRRSNATIIAVKIEFVVDLNTSELSTYVHAHFVVAVPKQLTVIELNKLRAASALLLRGHFVGELMLLHKRMLGYILKHPIKLEWSGGDGSLTSLDAAARLTPSQAAQLFRATERLSFFTITRAPCLDLCPSLKRLMKAAEGKRLAIFLPKSGDRLFLVRQAEMLEKQRRAFERLANRITDYPWNPEIHRRAFTATSRDFWTDYRSLVEVGTPTSLVHLNRLAGLVHRRPPKVPLKRWAADLRRIRRMKAVVTAIEIIV